MAKKNDQKKSKGNVYQRRQRKFAAVIAIILAAVLVIGLIASALPAGAVDQSEIDSLKEQADEINSQKQELQEQLESIQDEQDTYTEQKSVLEQQASALQSQIDNIQAQIDVYDDDIATHESEIASLQEQEQEEYELFCSRVREMEEEGTTSYLAILFNASSFEDLLDRFNFINEIIEYDNGIMNQLVATRTKLQTEKTELEDSRAAEQEQKDSLSTTKSELNSKISEINAIVDKIQEDIDETEDAIDDLSDEEESVRAQVSQKQKELEAQIEAARQSGNTVVVSDGTYTWPVPGYYTLTSAFGPRYHPITGVYHNHTGIDIAAPCGTPIHAVSAGTVSVSQYGSSYGQYVVIYHGNGLSTLYAHMLFNSQTVSVGDTVEKGDIIGYVGTTGSSTGYHLHLEFQLNGSRVDPEAYFPSLDSVFYRRYNE